MFFDEFNEAVNDLVNGIKTVLDELSLHVEPPCVRVQVRLNTVRKKTVS